MVLAYNINVIINKSHLRKKFKWQSIEKCYKNNNMSLLMPAYVVLVVQINKLIIKVTKVV